MKVSIIFLDYSARQGFEYQSKKNLENCGIDVSVFRVDMLGIAKAINFGLKITQNFDYVAIMANDIEMPVNWLKSMIEWAERLKSYKVGIVGIHTVESLPGIDKNGVHPTWCPFGNWLLTREVINSVGAFNEDHDPYGMQDSDYGYRANRMGFYNFYIPELKASHIGHDCGEQTDYRKMKDDGLSRAGVIYMQGIERYNETKNYYLPLIKENG